MIKNKTPVKATKTGSRKKVFSRGSSQVVVAVSGGFDPVHIGHIRLFREAKKLGDKLVVILNNDNWLKKKKTHVFMHEKERKEILEFIKEVDEVVLSSHPRNPKDMSVSKELLKIKPDIFAKGGDQRNEKDVPETEACNKVGCKMLFHIGPGGNFKYSSWLLANYVRSLSRAKQINVNKTVVKIGKIFKKSTTPVSSEIKLMLSEIILNVMNRRRAFGLFVILGWRDKWNRFTDVPDSNQDIYKKHNVNLKDLVKEGKHYRVESTLDFDGAILIDKNGNITDSGIIIEGLRPRVVANKLNPGKFKDLSEQFGFRGKVHSRHLSAIAASHIFKGTTVFTVSEENDSFHVFENGKIIYSL
jgi:D-beta-D-heptose 7-phosphate kinase/D-beta-D-heptose 1-phosphate adenosyltransferase